MNLETTGGSSTVLALGFDCSADTLTGTVCDAKGRPVADARVDVATAARPKRSALRCSAPPATSTAPSGPRPDARNGKFRHRQAQPQPQIPPPRHRTRHAFRDDQETCRPRLRKSDDHPRSHPRRPAPRSNPERPGRGREPAALSPAHSSAPRGPRPAKNAGGGLSRASGPPSPTQMAALSS